MKTKFIFALLLASSALFAGPRIAIGVGIGVPVAPGYYVPPVPRPVYAPPAYAAPAYVPPPAYLAPGLGYSWAGGYWYSGGRRFWRPGYWAAPRVRVYAGRGWRYR